MTLTFPGRTRVVFALTASLLGCTALASIQEGHPGPSDETGPGSDAAASTVDGEGGDSGVPHGPDGGHDGTVPREGAAEGGPDSTIDASPDATADAPADASSETTLDAPADSPVPAELACNIDPNSRILVDDSSNYDAASGAGFIHGLWFAKTTTNNQIFLFSQLASDETQFLEYDLDFNQEAVLATNSWRGIGGGRGVQLIDVSTQPAGANGVKNAALATFPRPVIGLPPSDGIQVIPLPSNFGGFVPANAFQVGIMVAKVQSGVFLQPTDLSADWLVATQGTSVTRYDIFAGSGTALDASSYGQVLAASTTTKYFVDDAPFFDMAGSLYAFVGGVDPEGGVSAFRMPDDLSDAAASTIPSSAGARVLTARRSAIDPSNVLLLAAMPVNMGTQEAIFHAVAPAAQLTSLPVGAPPYTQSALLQSTELPLANAGLAWIDDETVIVGPRQDGTGLYLVWLGPDGHAVSRPATSGALLDLSDPVPMAAVQFDQHSGESGATLFVAWIDDAPGGSQRIYAVKVLCSPLANDGG